MNVTVKGVQVGGGGERTREGKGGVPGSSGGDNGNREEEDRSAEGVGVAFAGFCGWNGVAGGMDLQSASSLFCFCFFQTSHDGVPLPGIQVSHLQNASNPTLSFSLSLPTSSLISFFGTASNN